MSKTPLQWSKALIAMLLTILSLSANAEKRCIYYNGSFNNFPQPIEDYETWFKTNNYVLYETEDGSNIYEGTIKPWDSSNIHFFRFYTALNPKSGTNFSCWDMNVIHPTVDVALENDINYGITPEPVSVLSDKIVNDKVLSTDGIFLNFSGGGYWVMYSNARPVKFIVDLNNNTLKAISSIPVWVMDGDPIPTLDTVDNYTCAFAKPKIFIPKGKCRFALYNFLDEALYPGGASDKDIRTTSSLVSNPGEGFYTVSDWNGGTIELSPSLILTVSNPYKGVDNIPAFTGVAMVTPNDFVDLRNYKPSEVNVTANFPSATGVAGQTVYSLNASMKEGEKFAFLVYENDQLKKVIDPAVDTKLVFSGTKAISSVTTAKDAEINYWTSPLEGNVTITLDTANTGLDALTVEMPSLAEPRSIYLVGQPTGWLVPEKANEAFYKDWRLFMTTEGYYYGAFDIPADKAMFRFYTALTGWDDDSLGSQIDDSPIECDWTSTNFIGIGKGAFNFTNWKGGMMYIKVDLDKGLINVSDTPTDVTFEDASEGIVIPDGIKAIGYDFATREIEPGVYRIKAVDEGKDIALRLVRTKHTFSSDEPAYERSFSLTFDESPLEFDESGVAEVKFKYNDGINLAKASTLTLPDKPTMYFEQSSCEYLITIDFNTSTLYVDRQLAYYNYGTLTNGEVPTYSTRAKFVNALSKKLNSPDGQFIDLPKGEITIIPMQIANGLMPYAPTEAVADSDGVFATNLTEEAIVVGIHVADYPGGKSYYSSYYSNDGGSQNFANRLLAPISSFKWFNLYLEGEFDYDIYDYPRYPLGKLNLVDPASMTFNGSIDFDLAGRTSQATIIATPNFNPDIYIGGISGPISGTNGTVDFDVTNGGLNITNLLKGKLDITLSLTTLKGQLKYSDCTTGKIIYSYCNGRLATQSQLSENGEIVNVPTLIYKAYCPDYIGHINFISSDGEIIAPAANVDDVVFDRHGRATLPFTITKIDFTTPQAAIEAATAAPTWNLECVENYYVSEYYALIDLENNLITFTCAKKASAIYAVVYNGNDIIDFDEVKEHELTLTGNAYTGTATIESDGTLCLLTASTGGYIFARSYGSIFYTGVYPIWSSDSEIEFVDGATKAIPVTSNLVSAYKGFTFTGNPGADVDITYKPDEGMLYLTMTVTGVEAIEADSNANAPVEYYNLQGVRVTNPTNGIYIRRQGSRTDKVLIK